MAERSAAPRLPRRAWTAPGATIFALAIVAAACGTGEPVATTSPSPTSTAPAAPSPTVPPLPTPTPDAASWPLAWSDEFDGPAGTPPDPATWGFDLGDGTAIGLEGWGNRERQFYTDHPDNASLDGEGNLAITVRAADGDLACYYGPCTHTSARLLTAGRREFQYGRIEARIQVAGAWGLWPAFWMLGTNLPAVGWPASGEIDIMEFVGRRPNEVLGTAHGPGYSGSSGVSGEVDLGEPVAAAFHTFAIEWWPGHIAWFLDGVKYHEVHPEDVAPNAWVFDRPFFMVLNVAVGGNLGGPVPPDMELPQVMLVDYVRVYQEAIP